MELGLAWPAYDLITLFVREFVPRFFVSQGLGLLESRQATFLEILLFSLAFRLCFDSVHPDLINVLIITGLKISGCTPLAFPGRPIAQTTSPTTKEDAAEEEEDPCCDGEPYGVADRCLTASAVDPGLCQEKEREVKYEGQHGNSGGKTGDTGTATCRGDLSDMSKKTEDSGTCGQDECNDVEDETVCYPFGDYVGDLDSRVVPEQGVDVCVSDRVAWWIRRRSILTVVRWRCGRRHSPIS